MYLPCQKVSVVRLAVLADIGRNDGDKVSDTDLSRYSHTSLSLAGKIVTKPRYYIWQGTISTGLTISIDSNGE